jgi:predicted aspartyl protease
MYDMDSNTSDCLKTNISEKEPEKAEKPSQKENEDRIEEISLVHRDEPLRMQEKTRVMRRSMKMEREVKMPLSFTAPTNGLTFRTRALLDSGATDSFIDRGMIEKYGLEVETLEKPIPVYNADGGRNKLGDITGYVTLRMIHGLHEELMRLYATSLGKETILIGHDWLRKHNPVIDWITGEVEMSRCPKNICGYEHRTKRAIKQRKLRIKRRETKKQYTEFEQSMRDLERKTRQPTCEEVEDEYDFERKLRSFIVDPYEWDPSAEQSPSEEEQDELCAELLGEREWEEGDEDDNAKLNEQLKSQGVNRRAR